jgi:hypothetical protein
MSIPRSLPPVLSLAMRESGAAGYAVYEDGVRTFSSGLAVPESDGDGLAVLSFELRGATLSFVFPSRTVSREAAATLDRVVETVEEIWRLGHLSETYSALAARIGVLEMELADSKIADRASGLAGCDRAFSLISRHVETVLRPSQFAALLERITQTLEEEVADRELAMQAKRILQTVHGMSEEQAHLHLRITSRKTRKPLKEVAKELIGSY